MGAETLMNARSKCVCVCIYCGLVSKECLAERQIQNITYLFNLILSLNITLISS